MPRRRALTAAEAWCWVARMLSKEADAHFYAWPKTEAGMRDGAEFEHQSRLAYERAKKLGATNRTWKSALRKWDAGAEQLNPRADDPSSSA